MHIFITSSRNEWQARFCKGGQCSLNHWPCLSNSRGLNPTIDACERPACLWKNTGHSHNKLKQLEKYTLAFFIISEAKSILTLSSLWHRSTTRKGSLKEILLKRWSLNQKDSNRKSSALLAFHYRFEQKEEWLRFPVIWTKASLPDVKQTNVWYDYDCSGQTQVLLNHQHVVDYHRKSFWAYECVKLCFRNVFRSNIY